MRNVKAGIASAVCAVCLLAAVAAGAGCAPKAHGGPAGEGCLHNRRLHVVGRRQLRDLPCDGGRVAGGHAVLRGPFRRRRNTCSVCGNW
ncbi:MAG: hypothetical protein V8S24_00705, partial [Gordonibacter pamelaeae]